MATALKLDSISATELEAILRQTLPPQYHRDSLAFFQEGGTRTLYTVEWGPAKERRVIKVDKTPTSPRAIRHVERGYNTAHDLTILAHLKEPERNHVNKLVDYGELDTEGYGTYTVEKFVDGESLNSRLKRGPLSVEEFKNTFRQVLQAEQYLINEEGIFHRDLSDENILIDRKGGVVVTDLANGGKIGTLQPKALPTTGKHHITDPKLLSKFTGEERAYDVQSEIYAIGENMAHALLGHHIFELDADKGVAVKVNTGESVLDKDGRIDSHAYRQLLANGLTQLPKKAGKFRDIIFKAMSIDNHIRYGSIEELVADFDRACKPTLTERFPHLWKLLAAGGAAAAILTGGVSYGVQQMRDAAARAIQEARLYPIESKTDELNVTNNLFTVSNTLRDKDFKTLYPGKAYVEVKPNEIIRVRTDAYTLPHSHPQESGSVLPPFPVRVYIEGFGDSTTHVFPASREHRRGAMSDFTNEVEYTIPKAEPGVYTLVVEVNPVQFDTTDNQNYDEHFKYVNPGKVLSRQRIPLVIGDVPRERRLNLRDITLGYEPNLSLGTMEEEEYWVMAHGNFEYTMLVPELHLQKQIKGVHEITQLNGAKTKNQYLVQLTAKDEGGRLTSVHLPVERDVYPNGYSPLRIVAPDTAFYKKIQKLHEERR